MFISIFIFKKYETKQFEDETFTKALRMLYCKWHIVKLLGYFLIAQVSRSILDFMVTI